MRRVLTMSLVILLAAAAGWAVAAWSGRPDDEAQKPNDNRGPSVGLPREFEPARLVARADVAELTENSGIVASSVDPGILWAHNDSGDAPVLYCLTFRGETCGRVTLSGIDPVDWEDIARGPGPDPGTSYLYVADIGDNTRVRSGIAMVRIPEPMRGDATVSDAEILTLSYPRGPRDAESAFVHPQTGDVYIITKGASPVAYVAKAPLEPDVTTELEKVASVPAPGLLPGPTGADISSDGRFLVLSTYAGAYEFEITGSLAEAFDAGGIEINLPPVMQREAVAYDLNATRIFTTSEGAPMPLYVSRLRR
jgi:hypothetical protein